MEVLRKIFNISVSEYVVLSMCDRDDITKFGLNPVHTTTAQRPLRDSLAAKSYIRYSVHTGKWELTSVGRQVLTLAPICVQTLERSRTVKAQVLDWPTRDNSA